MRRLRGSVAFQSEIPADGMNARVRRRLWAKLKRTSLMPFALTLKQAVRSTLDIPTISQRQFAARTSIRVNVAALFCWDGVQKKHP